MLTTFKDDTRDIKTGRTSAASEFDLLHVRSLMHFEHAVFSDTRGMK